MHACMDDYLRFAFRVRYTCVCMATYTLHPVLFGASLPNAKLLRLLRIGRVIRLFSALKDLQVRLQSPAHRKRALLIVKEIYERVSPNPESPLEEKKNLKALKALYRKAHLTHTLRVQKILNACSAAGTRTSPQGAHFGSRKRALLFPQKSPILLRCRYANEPSRRRSSAL